MSPYLCSLGCSAPSFARLESGRGVELAAEKTAFRTSTELLTRAFVPRPRHGLSNLEAYDEKGREGRPNSQDG